MNNASKFILEVIYFLALIICWVVIWVASGLTLISWKGFALFVAVLIISMLATIREWIADAIEKRYLNNNERRHKKV